MIASLIQQTIDRLKALEIFADVLTAADLADLDEMNQPTPGASVIYQGLAIDDTAHSAKAAKVRDRLGVVITIRFNSYDAGRLWEDAAPLTEAAIASLMGWTPTDYLNPLKLTGAPEPLFTAEGFAYFPLEFEIGRTIKASS